MEQTAEERRTHQPTTTELLHYPTSGGESSTKQSNTRGAGARTGSYASLPDNTYRLFVIGEERNPSEPVSIGRDRIVVSVLPVASAGAPARPRAPFCVRVSPRPANRRTGGEMELPDHMKIRQRVLSMCVPRSPSRFLQMSALRLCFRPLSPPQLQQAAAGL